MNPIFRSLSICALLLTILFTPSFLPAECDLSITYPPPKIETSYPGIRIAGASLPSAVVTIRGQPVKVYSTGAFVGYVDLKEGKNTIEITARAGECCEKKTVRVKCIDPLLTSPVSPLTIDTRQRKPAVDTLLQPGDTLHLRCKGSPGMKAYWSLEGIALRARMKELVPAREGILEGIGGLYEAHYRVKEGDCVENGRVTFTIAGRDGAVVEESAAGHVTLLPTLGLSGGIVGDDGALLSETPGGRGEWKLDPGTRVNLCGEEGGYYRVFLSPEARCWTAKKSIIVKKNAPGWEPAVAGAPFLEHTSWGARVTIPCTGTPPCRVVCLPEDGILSVTLYATNAGKCERIVSGTPFITHCSQRRGDGNVVEVLIHLRDTQLWGYRSRMTDKGIMVEVKAPPEEREGPFTVVIDPGHGGRAPGAASPTGIAEKTVNSAICSSLKKTLEGKGIRVVMTRTDDSSLSLSGRVKKSREAECDLFLSIHNNSAPGRINPLDRRGADTFYGSAHAKGLAEEILAEMGKAGLRCNTCHRANFAVILPTDYVAVLVECSYLSHPEDEALLLREPFVQGVGEIIGRAVISCAEKRGVSFESKEAVITTTPGKNQ